MICCIQFVSIQYWNLEIYTIVSNQHTRLLHWNLFYAYVPYAVISPYGQDQQTTPYRRMRPWSWHGRVWALIQSLGLIKVVTHIGIALWSLSPQCQDPLQQLLRFTCAHCWSAIQKCCNRWAGCVEEIDCAPPSGATIQDRVSKLSPTVSKKILTTSSLNVHLLDSVGALSTLFGTPVYR